MRQMSQRSGFRLLVLVPRGLLASNYTDLLFIMFILKKLQKLSRGSLTERLDVSKVYTLERRTQGKLDEAAGCRKT